MTQLSKELVVLPMSKQSKPKSQKNNIRDHQVEKIMVLLSVYVVYISLDNKNITWKGKYL